MKSSKIEQETKAIQEVTHALEPLDQKAQQRVLDYVIRRFGLPNPADEGRTRLGTKPGGHEGGPAALLKDRITDIRALRDEKRPTQDVQMAAIVAYYLAELAPADQRKTEITKADMTKYFKQAGYKLPTRPDATLPNAKAAGYFDGVGRGKYRLNPVGHNLVVHNLPRPSQQADSR